MVTYMKIYRICVQCRLEYRLNDRYFKYNMSRYVKVDFINMYFQVKRIN